MPSAVVSSSPRQDVVSPVAMFVLYQVAAWSLLAALAWGVSDTYPAAGSAIVLVVAAFVTAPLLAFIARRGAWSAYPTAAFRLAVVRPALYAQLILPVVAGAGAIGLAVGAFFDSARIAAQTTSGVALLGMATLLFVGWIGSRRVVVRSIDVQVPDLPPAFDGLRIVQLSDMHLGPQTSRKFLSRVTNAVASLAPDMVVVTGDLVDDRAEDTRYFARWLEAMHDASAPELGVYLIPGNHDVYAGWDHVACALNEFARARVLVNESVVVSRGNAKLAVVGVGDPAARGRTDAQGRSAAPDLTRAFAHVPPSMSTIVLAHNPALWPSIVARRVALTLSGHTHWGQFALPSRGWSLATPFLEHSMGAYRDGASMLYVHPGTGFWGIPFRIGALPEVARITLRRGDQAEITRR